ncbi:hypothetical protein [Caulobacter sp. FWC2]|uniref:hypothetical protein n=1 Tax=Caulobacter sp. FWC2 TaxID=69664 RepID=UPI000C14E06D|nr:hypothetical protein [Caulobacter sp. FWC2]PIB90977.1 hypothetical protein CSW62_04975 [Caulobacter sp. FWC2]
MSTEYMTRTPMSLDEFKKTAAANGWTYAIVDDRDVVRKEGGDGSMAFDLRETPCADGETRVEFTRYAANDVRELVDLFDCFSEHDDEFWTLCRTWGDED